MAIRDQRASNRDYDRRDRAAEIARVRARQDSTRDMLRGLRNVPCEDCSDCGRRYAACAMDFDHRSPGSKRHTVSRMVGRAGSAAILAEVAKCDIVCANCHRDRTFRRRMAGTTRGRE